MANQPFPIKHRDSFNLTERVFYVADTDAGKPASSLNVGDLCWAVDTGMLYLAILSTVWTRLAQWNTANYFSAGQIFDGFFDLIATGPYTGRFFPEPQSDNRFWGMPNGSGAVVIVGDGANPPAAGFAGKVNATAQSAAIASTNLTDTTSAGLYRVTYDLEDTTSQVGVATVQLQVTATDLIGARTQSSVAITLVTAGATPRDSGTFVVKLASGNITYATAITGVIGLGRYALTVRCELLG